MGRLIAEQYQKWEQECSQRFQKLKANEEELNRIFIEIYGLQNELTPEIDDKSVTVRKADLQKEIKSLISYAVGCLFGRYSLDCEGIAYAGGKWDDTKYQTMIPEKDNFLFLCEEAYFQNDIVSRFSEFIRTAYGEDTLQENLQFIADVLGGKGSPPEIIRNYFLHDFYADHCKTYQKRPIYWLLDSGKKNTFKALLYIHRYRPDTLKLIRTKYLCKLQAYYTAKPAQLLELQNYDEKFQNLANKMLPLALDDGIKANYEKLQEILAKIK